MSSSDLCHVGCARMAGQKSLIKFSFFGSRGSSHGHFRLGSPPPPVCPLFLFVSVRLISNICNSTSRLRNRAEESYDVEISLVISWQHHYKGQFLPSLVMFVERICNGGAADQEGER